MWRLRLFFERTGWKPILIAAAVLLALAAAAVAFAFLRGGDETTAPDLSTVAPEESTNLYYLRAVAPETRPRLDSGRLGIVVLERPGPRRSHYAWTATSLEVGAEAAIYAGLDGEAVALAPPLRFSIRPRALRVRIRARHPGASPSAQLTSLDPRQITKSGRRPVTRAPRKLAP